MTRSRRYFATACGHRHRTAARAASCRDRGYDVETRGPRPVIEVWIRPGRTTLTKVVPQPIMSQAKIVPGSPGPFAPADDVTPGLEHTIEGLTHRARIAAALADSPWQQTRGARPQRSKPPEPTGRTEPDLELGI
jgi:hypothetical protein